MIFIVIYFLLKLKKNTCQIKNKNKYPAKEGGEKTNTANPNQESGTKRKRKGQVGGKEGKREKEQLNAVPIKLL